MIWLSDIPLKSNPHNNHPPSQKKQILIHHCRALAICLLLSFFISGCASPEISKVSRSPSSLPSGKIGVAPRGGILADAIGVELFQRGFDVVPAIQIQEILGKAYWDQAQMVSTHSLSQLRRSGIGTLLVVRTAPYAYGEPPQNAVVRMIDTMTGETLLALTWESGSDSWGIASSELVSTARDITNELTRGLSKHRG